MHRSNVALRRAPDPAVLHQLASCERTGPFFREHQKRPGDDYGCWWFSGTKTGSSPGGRFDLQRPRGTLYLAESPLAAALERCGRYLASGRPIPVTAVADRVVTQLEGTLCALGDLTDKHAVKVGITQEINTLNDYEITASWAIAADRARFQGLKYTPRFSAEPVGAIAYFGTAGAHKPPELSISSSKPLAKVLDGEGYSVSRLPSVQEAADNSLDVDSE